MEFSKDKQSKRCCLVESINRNQSKRTKVKVIFRLSSQTAFCHKTLLLFSSIFYNTVIGRLQLAIILSTKHACLDPNGNCRCFHFTHMSVSETCTVFSLCSHVKTQPELANRGASVIHHHNRQVFVRLTTLASSNYRHNFIEYHKLLMIK